MLKSSWVEDPCHNGVRTRNKCDLLQGPKSKRKQPPSILVPEEIEELIKAVGRPRRSHRPARMRLLIGMLYRHGLRISEALALEVEDLDFDRRLIYIRNGKGGKSRTVGFDRTVRQWALDFTRKFNIRTGRLFNTHTGRPWRADCARHSLKFLVSKTTITKRVHFHAFRHTYAWELAMENTPMHVIQQLLGHQSLATTSIYLAHVAPEVVIRVTERRGAWMD